MEAKFPHLKFRVRRAPVYIFGHELGPAVCYHEFNAFEELNK